MTCDCLKCMCIYTCVCIYTYVFILMYVHCHINTCTHENILKLYTRSVSVDDMCLPICVHFPCKNMLTRCEYIWDHAFRVYTHIIWSPCMPALWVCALKHIDNLTNIHTSMLYLVCLLCECVLQHIDNLRTVWPREAGAKGLYTSLCMYVCMYVRGACMYVCKRREGTVNSCMYVLCVCTGAKGMSKHEIECLFLFIFFMYVCGS
jgi:hypothetical protein